ncbi:tape measure protein [Elizabethkingia anophelis]|nr:tape measure protein [Elizabethkingia anophelis]MCT3875051.1 tape measure protein [Elizabethkingia anophelis]
MNNSQGALYFGAGIDMTQWRNSINEMRRDIFSLNNSVQQEARNIDSAFKNLSLGIAGYFSARSLLGFTKELINVRGEFQKTEIAFTTMLGNGEQAKSLMDQMVNLAAKTPFSLQDVSAGAKQLLAFQIPADQVVDTLTRMGNIAAGLSIPLSRINLVYGQVKAKGKLMGDDLRQFTEAGIPMVAELAKKFNKSTAEISAMVSAGKIGFKDVKDVLFAMTNEGGMFFNLMEKQSASLSGKISNLEDAWDQMLNKIGESQEGLISKGIDGLAYLVEHYEEVLRVITTLIAAYGTYRAVLITVAVAQRALAIATFIKEYLAMARALGMATANMIAFNTATLANPYTLAAAGIAAVVAALVYFNTGSSEAKNNAEKMAQAVNSATASVGKESLELRKLYNAATDEKKSRKERTEAVKELQRLYPSYFGNLSKEIIMTGKAKANYDELRDAIIASARARAIGTELERREGERLAEEAELQEKLDEATRRRQENLKKGYKDQYISIGGGSSTGGVASGQTYKSTAAQQYKNDLKAQSEAQENLNAFRNKALKEDEFYIKEKIKLDEKARKYNKDKERDTDIVAGGAKKGTQRWYEEEVRKLEEANKELVPQSKEWLKNMALIKKYNDLIHVKSSDSNKQLAELIPKGTIAELQQRSNLLNDAINVAVNGVVRLRKLDKYGQDKDKKGTPFYTGQVISVEEAYKQLDEIDEAIRLKQRKTFDEQLSETERQWKARYKIAKYYGEEIANAQFPNLKGNSYFDEISRKFEILDEKRNSGVSLTNAELSQWDKLKVILDGLLGEKDNVTQYTENIEKALDKIPSLTDQIRYLKREVDKQSDNKSGLSQGFLAIASNKFQEKLREQEKQYADFLKAHRSFEEQKAEITQKYAEQRTKIDKDKTLTPEQKVYFKKESFKAEGNEVAQSFLNGLTNDPSWAKAFQDLGNVTTSKLRELRGKILAQINLMIAAGTATPESLKILYDQLKLIDGVVINRNPFKALSKALKEFNETASDSSDKLEKLRNVALAVKDSSDLIIQGISAGLSIAEDLGIQFNDETKDIISNVQTTLGGISDLASGIASGNPVSIIKGIAGVVKGISGFFNGDNKKERQIKNWQKAVDDLKSSYQDLEYQLKKTLGEGVYQEQGKMIANLREQQRVLKQMADTEASKKKSDDGKIREYQEQSKAIDRQVDEIITNMKNQISGTDAKDLADKLGDALFDAWQKGEDGVIAYGKTVDEVMANAVKSALKQKLLQEPMQKLVDDMIEKMGFKTRATNDIEKQISDAEARLNELTNSKTSIWNYGQITAEKQALKNKIDSLRKQLADAQALNTSGSFDGLTKEEREAIKQQGIDAMKKYTDALKEYEDLFGAASGSASSLEGAIKGMSEQTADLLAGQFNAIRINVGEILKVINVGQEHAKQNLFILSQIKGDTSNLIQIRKDISDLNSKITNNNGLRGSGL